MFPANEFPSCIPHNITIESTCPLKLAVAGVLQWFTRQASEVENSMTCVERMLEYTELDREALTVKEGGGLPQSLGWPQSSMLEYDQVRMMTPVIVMKGYRGLHAD